MSVALTKSDTETLVKCEQIIERGLTSFTEVGNALLTVRDSRLYRAEFDTFEDYCQRRWNFKRSYAYELIDSAIVTENVRNSGQPPSNPAQARPLAKLAPEKQREVWQEVVRTAPEGKVTAKHVEATVERVIESTPNTAQKIQAKAPVYTPSNGLMYADLAIDQLKKIQPNDKQRREAFAYVITWAQHNS